MFLKSEYFNQNDKFKQNHCKILCLLFFIKLKQFSQPAYVLCSLHLSLQQTIKQQNMFATFKADAPLTNKTKKKRKTFNREQDAEGKNITNIRGVVFTLK